MHAVTSLTAASPLISPSATQETPQQKDSPSSGPGPLSKPPLETSFLESLGLRLAATAVLRGTLASTELKPLLWQYALQLAQLRQRLARTLPENGAHNLRYREPVPLSNARRLDVTQYLRQFIRRGENLPAVKSVSPSYGQNDTGTQDDSFDVPKGAWFDWTRPATTTLTYEVPVFVLSTIAPPRQTFCWQTVHMELDGER